MQTIEQKLTAAVEQLVTDVTKHVERQVRERTASALGERPDRWAAARAALAAKRAKPAGKRGKRHCRKCGSVDHDLRNHGKRKAA